MQTRGGHFSLYRAWGKTHEWVPRSPQSLTSERRARAPGPLVQAQTRPLTENYNCHRLVVGGGGGARWLAGWTTTMIMAGGAGQSLTAVRDESGPACQPLHCAHGDGRHARVRGDDWALEMRHIFCTHFKLWIVGQKFEVRYRP